MSSARSDSGAGHAATRTLDAVPITVGTSQGKLRLIDKRNGKSWIFEPASGERTGAYTGSGMATGELYRRAPASSMVGRDLGLDAPDAPVVRYSTGGVGSLQAWVPEGQTLKQLYDSDKALYEAVMGSQLKADIDAFDYLIANLDRNAENLMVMFEPGKREVARLCHRHGSRVPADQHAPPLPCGFFHRTALPIPATISKQMAFALRHMSANRYALSQTLTAFLGPEELGGFLRRLDEIVAEMNRGTPGWFPELTGVFVAPVPPAPHLARRGRARPSSRLLCQRLDVPEAAPRRVPVLRQCPPGPSPGGRSYERSGPGGPARRSTRTRRRCRNRAAWSGHTCCR